MKGSDFNIKNCARVDGKAIVELRGLLCTLTTHEIILKVFRGVALQYSEVGDKPYATYLIICIFRLISKFLGT